MQRPIGALFPLQLEISVAHSTGMQLRPGHASVSGDPF